MFREFSCNAVSPRGVVLTCGLACIYAELSQVFIKDYEKLAPMGFAQQPDEALKRPLNLCMKLIKRLSNS